MSYDDYIEVRDIEVDGVKPWHWIKSDTGAWTGPKKDWEEHHKNKYFRHLRNRQVCVTAGANCGMYTRLYSDLFDVVYAFEPDSVNFHCMVMNNQRDNVFKINAALGETPAFCSMQRVTDRNVGMHKVSGNGFIPIMTIDNMNLPVLDFLQLDVEGYEAHSLKGAEKTIARCRPVIVVEGTKADSLLQQYNYQMVERSGHADRVWIPRI